METAIVIGGSMIVRVYKGMFAQCSLPDEPTSEFQAVKNLLTDVKREIAA